MASCPLLEGEVDWLRLLAVMPCYETGVSFWNENRLSTVTRALTSKGPITIWAIPAQPGGRRSASTRRLAMWRWQLHKAIMYGRIPMGREE